MLRNDSKYFGQEFDNTVLNLVIQKWYYHYEYKEELTSKAKFYSLLISTKISEKKYDKVRNVWKKFQIKMMKDYRNLCFKFDILLLADFFEKFRNIYEKELEGF